MPTNNELTSQAIALSKILDIEIDTKGLSNAKLADLVTDLKAKKRDAETVTQADKPTKIAKSGYFVKEGKALTSKRGIIADGEYIEPNDLAGGVDALEQFVKSGHVGKK